MTSSHTKLFRVTYTSVVELSAESPEHAVTMVKTAPDCWDTERRDFAAEVVTDDEVTRP